MFVVSGMEEAWVAIVSHRRPLARRTKCTPLWPIPTRAQSMVLEPRLSRNVSLNWSPRFRYIHLHRSIWTAVCPLHRWVAITSTRGGRNAGFLLWWMTWTKFLICMILIIFSCRHLMCAVIGLASRYAPLFWISEFALFENQRFWNVQTHCLIGHKQIWWLWCVFTSQAVRGVTYK